MTLSASTETSYVWKEGTTNLSTTSQNLMVSTSGDYTVEVTNANGCSSTSAITSVTVSNHPSTGKIEAEDYCDMLGIQTEDCSEGTLNVGYTNANDWIAFYGVDLTDMKSIKARVASINTGGEIEVKVGNASGTVIATIPVTNTGGWQNWTTDSIDLNTQFTGEQDVYFVFKEGTGYLVNINWVEFSKEKIIITPLEELKKSTMVSIYPNPFRNIVTIDLKGQTAKEINIYNSLGQLVYSQKENTEKETVDVSELSPGAYTVKITDGRHVITEMILKE